MHNRRFRPPWTIEEYNDACFVVSDSAAQKLAYVYFEDEPGRRSSGQAAHPRLAHFKCRKTVPSETVGAAPQAGWRGRMCLGG